MSNWHQLETSQVLEKLESDQASGLSQEQIRKCRDEHGPNELVETGGRSPLRILWDQLRSALVLLLVVAAAISVFLAEYTDAGAIFAIVLLNAILGFAQDYRAERALAALKKLTVPTVRARRDGRIVEISARELVPGDIVMFEVGNVVPADCRLLESVNLKTQEAALTGESAAVLKSVDPLTEGDLPLGDRRNMAYMGTVVTYGHGAAVVTETGMNTELGHIATSLQTVSVEPTPLQRRLAQLGRALALIALMIVGIILVLGLLRGEKLNLMLMTALSMAVAIVPEGLPAVATVALALGARRMFRRHALIRKLPAVETLGSVTVICSDKTGTLTENEMTVTVLDVAGDRLDLTQTARGADEEFQFSESQREQIDEHPTLMLLLAGAGLCNDAMLERDSDELGELCAIGDPTETALVMVAARMGLEKNELQKTLPRVGEVPFDSDRKRMTTVHEVSDNAAANGELNQQLTKLLQQLDAQRIAFTKGAVDSVLQAATQVWAEGGTQPLDERWRMRIIEANDSLASNGMRVLGVAMRRVDVNLSSVDADSVERELIFVGMLGMIDPPRPEVKDAVARCRTAGIRPVMITGDHPMTAIEIARQLGIGDEQRAHTGQEVERMSAEELADAAESASIYARVAPKHKLQIVKALQNQGQIVAMTGDGVNDAPALKQAHIGVAMGITGTDVSKEAADMVLLDDNFATIVNAVEQGRIVYDNIRKFVKYTMTSNAGEVWVMVLAPFLGMPLPLLPLQILWVNLVTDGLPGLALALEPAERNTMRRPPYPPDEHIFGRGMGRHIAWVGLLMGIVSLAMGFWYWSAGTSTEAHWRTIVFTVLTLSQMGHALAVRSSLDSLFRIGVFSNKALLGSVLLTFALQMGVVYLPFMQDIFKTTALSVGELTACLALSTIVFWGVEIEKLLFRRAKRD